MKQSLFLFFVLIVLVSCSKDDELEPISNEFNYFTEWSSHPDVNFDKIYLQNGFATDDRLYVVGNNYFLTFDENHQLVDEYLISEAGINIGSTNIPTITEKVFGYKSDGRFSPSLTLHLNENPSVQTTIDIHAVDTNFVGIITRLNNHFVITDDDILIIPGVEQIVNNTSLLAFHFFQLNITDTSIEYNYIKKVNYTVPVSFFEFFNVFLNEEFLYFGYFATFRLNLETDIITEVSAIQNPYPVQVQDTFFIVGSTLNSRLSFDFLINDSQISINTADYFDNNYLRFTSIDDVIIGYRAGMVKMFQINGNQIFIRSINNLDIFGRVTIDKIVEFQNRVYLITHNGLYSKELKEFF